MLLLTTVAPLTEASFLSLKLFIWSLYIAIFGQAIPSAFGHNGVAETRTYPKLLNTLAKTDLLILDDFGLAPLSAAESRDILEIIDDRSQHRSTIVAAQLPIEHWYDRIADPTVADAILDRLVHNAHKLNLNLKGESMRKLLNQP